MRTLVCSRLSLRWTGGGSRRATGARNPSIAYGDEARTTFSPHLGNGGHATVRRGRRAPRELFRRDAGRDDAGAEAALDRPDQAEGSREPAHVRNPDQPFLGGIDVVGGRPDERSSDTPGDPARLLAPPRHEQAQHSEQRERVKVVEDERDVVNQHVSVELVNPVAPDVPRREPGAG